MFLLEKEGKILNIVEEKFKQLGNMTKEEMWYIVKQNGTFWNLCYGASIIEKYKLSDKSKNINDFYIEKIEEINKSNNLQITKNYRVLRYLYYFGLASVEGSNYEDAKLTEVYYKIKELCDGKFENQDRYYEIIEQQIEKLYISWEIDEKYNDLRKEYDLYPLFLVYKVLIGLGELTGEYYLTFNELKIILGSTYKYDEYLKDIYIIMQIRSNKKLIEKLNDFKDLGSDIRYTTIMQNLKVFKVEGHKVLLVDDKIEYVKEKIKKYEKLVLPLKREYKKVLCSNISLFDFNKSEVEMKNIEKDLEKEEVVSIENNYVDDSIPRNLIIYGAPGTGKSSKVENEYRKKYFNNEYLYSRVTFNPNYAYTDFIGVYKPTTIYIKNDNGNEYYSSNKIDKLEYQMMPVIDYSFIPGPFIEILCKALNDKEHNYLLLIEEINRADVASVFGDVFQLLDRVKVGEDKGKSEYGIMFNKDIMDYISSKVVNSNDCFVTNKFVKIPNNMYIWATMNSADQNVNKMDTAFKRRWDFDYVSLNQYSDKIDDVYIKFNFLDCEIKWNDFREKLNNFLSKTLDIEEDKLVGPFFISDYKSNSNKRYIDNEDIKYKLLSYLKEDVLRHRVNDLFKENYTFAELIKEYDDNKNIFVSEFLNKIKPSNDLDSSGE